jgi:hypothetical protein
VAAVLILVSRPGDPPEPTVLQGRTELGRDVQLVFADDELQRFDSTVSFWCPSSRVWHDGLWQSSPATRFHQEDRRFRVRQRGAFPDFDPPVTVDYTMTGELAGDRGSAKGTLLGRAVFGRGHDSEYCRGSVTFRANRPESG